MKRKMSIRAISLLLAALILLGCVGTITAGAEESWKLSGETGIFLVNKDGTEFDNLSDQVLRFAAAMESKLKLEEALSISYGEEEKAGEQDILLVLDAAFDIDEQGYEIAVSGGSVTVAAADAAGLMYGCNALIRQLLTEGYVVSDDSDPDVAERALMLDIGRKYYSVGWIKEMIRELAWADMNALVLHFSEEMGLGIESKLYPWLAGRDGTLCTQAEVATDNRCLTQEEVAEIVKYAKLYHVQIIPSFDSPGHMNYIVKKFNEKCASQDYSFTYDGVEYTAKAGSEIGNYYHYKGETSIVKGSRNDAYSRGIDISNEVAVAFTKSLIEEYAQLFFDLGCRKFDIGGDELLGWGSAIVSGVNKWQQLDHWKTYAQNRSGSNQAVAYDGFLYYMNDLYDLVSGLGYESVRMWNDDALRSSDTGWKKVVNLNPNVEILYWSSGSNPVSTYTEAGHSVYNYLSDYNYCVLSSNWMSNSRNDFERAYEDLIYKEWNPYVFSDSGETIEEEDEDRVLGSAFCIWCDNPSLATEKEVREMALPLIRAHGAKAWDADPDVSYSTYAANQEETGNAPSGTADVEIWIIPDCADLEKAIADYEALDAELYTEESYAACTAAVEEARALLAGKPSQKEVDEAKTAVCQAMESLKLQPTADTTKLEAAIEAFETVDSSLYTEESFTMYAVAVEQAQALLESNDFTQEELDEALAFIETQKEALRSAETVSGVKCFISGKFKSSKVYVGKVATMALSVVKDAPIGGFEIYNDLNTTTEVKKATVSTSKSDRNNWSITFNPTKAEKGNRTYTVYAILEDGSRSADCLTLTITVK